jgi:hypothetical protein
MFFRSHPSLSSEKAFETSFNSVEFGNGEDENGRDDVRGSDDGSGRRRSSAWISGVTSGEWTT